MGKHISGRSINSKGIFVFSSSLKAAGACLGCAAVLMILWACGKKAPPVAPHEKPLTAVADLKGVIHQDSVKLSWSHDPANRDAVRYVVLLAREVISRPPCAECPLEFQKTGTVQVAGSLRKEKHNLEFSETVTAGFRYSYSVRPVTASGHQGPDSNIVVIEVR